MTPEGNQGPSERIDGYPSVEDLTEVLALVAAKAAYHPGPLNPGVAAPQATDELVQWLIAHRPLPDLQVRCLCTYRLGVWRVRGHHVEPKKERPKRFGPTGAVPYTEAVAAGKGNIKSSFTGDALVTFTYLCPKCDRDYPLRAETRMRLYLQELFLNSRTVVLKPGKLL